MSKSSNITNFSTNLAKGISIVFSPAIFSLYFIIPILLFCSPQPILISAIGSLLFLYILPWTPVVYLAKTRKTDIGFLSGRERIPFVLFSILSYSLGAILFYFLESKPLLALHLIYLIQAVSLVIGNMFLKPSIHESSFVSGVVFLSLMYNISFLLLLILAPVIGWSRYILEIHSIAELLFGFIIGIISGFTGIFLMYICTKL